MNKIVEARPRAPMIWSVALIALALAWFQVLPARGDVVTGKLAYQQGRYADALASWQPAAEHGDAEAAFSLAVLYMKGLGVEADPVQAYVWFARSLADGYRVAAQMVAALAEQLSPQQLAEAQRLIEAKR